MCYVVLRDRHAHRFAVAFYSTVFVSCCYVHQAALLFGTEGVGRMVQMGLGKLVLFACSHCTAFCRFSVHVLRAPFRQDDCGGDHCCLGLHHHCALLPDCERRVHSQPRLGAWPHVGASWPLATCGLWKLITDAVAALESRLLAHIHLPGLLHAREFQAGCTSLDHNCTCACSPRVQLVTANFKINTSLAEAQKAMYVARVRPAIVRTKLSRRMRSVTNGMNSFVSFAMKCALH